MRLFKNSKFKLAITTGLSLLSVFVASISTAAWFQVNGNRTATVSNMDVSAGNGDVSIDKVTGYKHVYNELDADHIDYSSSHLTTYSAKGESANSNINQGEIAEFDIPSDGVGYYIVGNAAWCEEQGKTASDAWKYSGGIRMDDDTIYGNKAILANYHFTSGMQIRIRHHYFANEGGSVVTKDEISSTGALDSNSYSTAAASMSGVYINISTSGYYNVYWTQNNKLSFYPISIDVVAPANVPTLGGKVTRANANVSGAQSVTKLEILNQTNDGNAKYRTFHIFACDYSTGYSEANFEACLSGQVTKQNSTINADDQTGKWSKNGSNANDFLVNNNGGSIYIPLWVKTFKLQVVCFGWRHWVDFKSQTAVNSSDNGQGHVCQVKLYKNGYDTIGESWIYDNPTHSFGDVTITKYGYYGNTRVVSGTETVQKFYLYTPTTLSASGYIGQRWYETFSSGEFDDEFTSTFISAAKTVYQQFIGGTYFTLKIGKLKHGQSVAWSNMTSIYSGNYTGTTETHFTPNNPTSYYGVPTGYESTVSTWYVGTSTACDFNTAYTAQTANPQGEANRTYLYAYYTETVHTLTIYRTYLTTSGTLDIDGSTTDPKRSTTATVYGDTAYSFTDSGFDNPEEGYEDYTLKCYSTSKTGTSSLGESHTFTADTSIYAVYQPISHKIYRKVLYCSKDSAGNYTQIDKESISGYATTYQTGSFAVPSSPKGSKFKKTDLDGGAYVFHFDKWYEGDADGCDLSTPYTTARKFTADGYLYAVYYYEEANYITTYVDASTPGWSDVYAHIWDIGDFDGYSMDGSAATDVKLRKVFDSGSYYSLTLPKVNNAKFLANNGSYANSEGTKGNQTDNVCYYSTTAANTNDHNGNPRDTYNCISIWNLEGGDWYRHFTWSYFVGHGKQGEGYYLVGTKAFTGSNENEWSFDSGIHMSEDNCPNGVKAQATNITLRAGMAFKIWVYDKDVGKSAEYYQLNDVLGDTETRVIAYNDSSNNNNVTINAVEGSKFNIYLLNTNKIQIVDNEQSTYLFFNRNVASYGNDAQGFKMGNGDGTYNLAILEGGIKVTDEDVTNGLSFAIRRKAGGSYHWYYYDYSNGTDTSSNNHGCTTDYFSGGSPTLAKASSTYRYGDAIRQLDSAQYGWKFAKKGFYKFYLTAGGLVSLASLPDYGEGYYIMPYDSTGAKGNSDTTSFTNGVKLKEINKTGVTNIAVYTCYSGDAGSKIYLRSYLNGIDRGVIPNLATDATTTSLVDWDSTNKVISFKAKGSYNIYVYKNASYSTYENTSSYNNGLTISVTQYDYSKFFAMNEIAINTAGSTNAAYVKSCDTTMVLDVEFTTNNTISAASLDIIKAGGGLSSYVGFTFAVVDNLGGANCYDYMRENYYDLDSTHSTLSSAVELAPGTHHAYILIDYLPSAISSMPTTSIANDFTFILKVNQINPVS